jgi:hypothetical protein
MFFNHDTSKLKYLPDEEIERLAKLPRVTKEQMYASWQARAPTFRFQYPGKHIVFNTKTCVFTLGDTLEEALNQHLGPAGGEDPRSFVSQYFKPRT